MDRGQQLGPQRGILSWVRRRCVVADRLFFLVVSINFGACWVVGIYDNVLGFKSKNIGFKINDLGFKWWLWIQMKSLVSKSKTTLVSKTMTLVSKDELVLIQQHTDASKKTYLWRAHELSGSARFGSSSALSWSSNMFAFSWNLSTSILDVWETSFHAEIGKIFENALTSILLNRGGWHQNYHYLMSTIKDASKGPERVLLSRAGWEP